jgi:phage repressor protein C with HTH and peptisase S24 domain
MIYKDENATLIKNYKAYTMRGSNMSPAVNEGDFLVVDITQKLILSGDIYVIEYEKSVVVCRLLLDRETVILLFDGTKVEIEEPLHIISIIGRVIEIKKASD